MEDYSEDEYDCNDEYEAYNDTYNDIDMSYVNNESYSSEEDIDDDEMAYRVSKRIAKELGEE